MPEGENLFEKFTEGSRSSYLGAPKTITEALTWAASKIPAVSAIGLLILELHSIGFISIPE